VMKNPTARAAIPEFLQKINLRLWLKFGEAKKGAREAAC
jgi:hypothetical protein